jgi:ATP adenylyltransferase/5',5'''-P-1,P-4-tetraphosphate phosphorylase II
LKNLDKKPFGGATSNPFLPPFEEGLFIDDLNSSHRLLFNKFPIFKNHLLVVS